MSETHLIVGGGQAGGWAAVASRKAGFTGRIVLAGEEPWLPYERPPLSKSVLTDPAEPSPPYFRDAASYRELGVEVILSARAERIDTAAARVHLSGGGSLAYDRLLIATGGRARALPVPGGHHAMLLRTLDDARQIRARLEAARHVVCVGAGVIGLEIASSARALGRSVTVLEAGPVAMGRSAGPEISAWIAALHRRAGVDLRLGLTVDAIERDAAGGCRLTLGDGTELAADLVVAGVGMTRCDQIVADAGIDTDGGVLVDQHGKSSAEGVYAAGDVAAFWHPALGLRLRLESWRHAQDHAIATAKSMCGAADAAPYADIPWFWTDQHGVNLQISGLPALAARTIVRARPDGITAIHLRQDGRVIGVTAANAPRDARAGLALVKAGIVLDPEAAADPGRGLQTFLRAAA